LKFYEVIFLFLAHIKKGIHDKVYKYGYLIDVVQTVGGKKMFKSLVALLPLCLLMGCSLGTNHVSCKNQIPISKSDILSYLSSNLDRPTSGGKMFCAYDPMYTEKEGNQIKYTVWTLCQEVNSKLESRNQTSTPAILIIEQRENQYHIVSHFTPDIATYMEDIRKYFPMEKDICDSSNRDVDQMEKEIIDQAKQYYHQQKPATH
jgi:hypothetical protein